ncbi:MAG: trimeric intracellular cation channel family protein [Dehalococcoidia bacterium]
MLASASLVLALDLIGTFVFAISGAAAGVKHRLDVFGVGALAFLAGNAGGLIRDVLIGAVPPVAVAHWRYAVISLVAGLVTFRLYPRVTRLQQVLLLFDAVGLSVFAVSGAYKALAYGLQPLAAALLGMVTGIGGGMVRDVLVREIPVVLRADFYALAALAGAMVVAIGTVLHWPLALATIGGAVLCLVMRLIAIRRGWNLPVADHAEL